MGQDLWTRWRSIWSLRHSNLSSCINHFSIHSPPPLQDAHEGHHRRVSFPLPWALTADRSSLRSSACVSPFLLSFPPVIGPSLTAQVFYATFDPVAGPTVLHQVPEGLISSSTSDDGAGYRSPSGSRSRSMTRERDKSRGREAPRSGDRGRERSRPRPMETVRTSSPSPLRISHPQPVSGRPALGSGSQSQSSGSSAAAPIPATSVSSPLSNPLQSLTISSSSTSQSSPAPTPHTTPHGNGNHSHANHSSHYGRAATPARGQPPLLDFGTMSEYIIPKKSLHGKLVTFRTPGAWDANGAGALDGEDGESDDEAERRYEYRVIGLPMVLEGEAGRYQRNQYMWNVCFVFRATASLAAFDPIVRKTARILRSAEVRDEVR